MSKCISRHGEFSEHQATDGVCDLCGVETSPLTKEQIKNLILAHATTYEQNYMVLCSGCGELIDFNDRRHVKVADHIASVIFARLDAAQ